MRVGIIHTVDAPCQCAESIHRGLAALGHECFLENSENIELRLPEIGRLCDLVFDHTDTYRGRGRFRSLVRSLLEAHGIPLVGCTSEACALADDKAASKERLEAAGIPTPPGILCTSKSDSIPSWLRPPYILKPAFEHMSRGLAVAQGEEDVQGHLADLLDRYGQPILVEAFIPGREFAVSVLDGPQGLEVLPPLEWETGDGDRAILTEEFKRRYILPGRRDAVQARLGREELGDLEALSRAAFKALRLRDYARFDVRRSPGGTFYFMEANVTPSMEPEEALALSARWAGMDFPTVLQRLLDVASKRLSGGARASRREIGVPLPAGHLRLRIRPGVHVPPSSTLELARLLDIRPDERVLDLGSGSGLLSLAAARLGAGQVVAVDIDPRALESTVENANLNGLSDRIEVRAGSWFEALRPEERFDVIVAAPPQTPGRRHFGPRFGGPVGTRHLLAIVDGAASRLEPVRGRLWIMAISIANIAEVMQRLRERFEKVEIVGESQRPFTPREYDELDEGLFRYLEGLRTRGLSDFHEAFGGEYVFRNLYIRAMGVKAG